MLTISSPNLQPLADLGEITVVSQEKVIPLEIHIS